MTYKVMIVEMPERAKDIQDILNDLPAGYQVVSITSDLGSFGHRLIVVIGKKTA